MHQRQKRRLAGINTVMVVVYCASALMMGALTTAFGAMHRASAGDVSRNVAIRPGWYQEMEIGERRWLLPMTRSSGSAAGEVPLSMGQHEVGVAHLAMGVIGMIAMGIMWCWLRKIARRADARRSKRQSSAESGMTPTTSDEKQLAACLRLWGKLDKRRQTGKSLRDKIRRRWLFERTFGSCGRLAGTSAAPRETQRWGPPPAGIDAHADSSGVVDVYPRRAAEVSCVTATESEVATAEGEESDEGRYYRGKRKAALHYVRPHIGAVRAKRTRALFLVDYGAQVSMVASGYVAFLRSVGTQVTVTKTSFRVRHGPNNMYRISERAWLPLRMGDVTCVHPFYIVEQGQVPGHRTGLLGRDFADRFKSVETDNEARTESVIDRLDRKHSWPYEAGDFAEFKPEPWATDRVPAWAAEEQTHKIGKIVTMMDAVGNDEEIKEMVMGAKPRRGRMPKDERSNEAAVPQGEPSDRKDFYRHVGEVEELELEGQVTTGFVTAEGNHVMAREYPDDDVYEVDLKTRASSLSEDDVGSDDTLADVGVAYAAAPVEFLEEQSAGRVNSTKARELACQAQGDALFAATMRTFQARMAGDRRRQLESLAEANAAHGRSDSGADSEGLGATAEELKRVREEVYSAEAALEEEIRADFTKQCADLMEDVMATAEDPGVMDDPELQQFVKDLIKVKDNIDDTGVRGWRKRYKGPMGQWLHETVQAMIREGTARVSRSKFDNPVLVIPKRRGNQIVGWRLVFDMRELNKHTVPMPNNPPEVWDVLHSLREARVMSDLDYRGGYMQLKLASDEEMARTAFTARTQFGNLHAELTTTSIGLLNAQAAFIAAVNYTLRHRLHKDVFTLADDLTVATKDETTHIEALEYVRRQAKRYNFRFERRKCKFGRKTLIKFGFLVGNGEVRVDPTRKKTIVEYPRPQNVEGVRRLLGLVQYWRPMIRNASAMCDPLTRLLRSGVKFEWGAQQEAALTALKVALTSDLVLTIPDPEKRLYVDTDASPTGIGAVAYHVEEGVKKPVWYFSRRLPPHQRNMSTTEKELLAIVVAVEKLDPIIGGREFTLNTDARNVVWLYNNPTVRGAAHVRVARWILKLQRMAGLMTLQHVPATHNKGADAFSRVFEDEKVMSLIEAAGTGLKAAEGADEIDLDEETVKSVPFDVEYVFTKEAKAVADAEDPNYTAAGEPRKAVASAHCIDANRYHVAEWCLDHRDDAADAEVNVRTLAEAAETAPQPVLKSKPRQSKTRVGSLTTRKRIPSFAYPDDDELQRAQEDELPDVVAYVNDPTSVEEAPVGFSGVKLYLFETATGAHVVRAIVDLDGAKVHVPVAPESVRQRLLALAHDAPAAAHRGPEVTLEYLRRMAFWPQMRGDAERYVESCVECGAQRDFRANPPRSHFSAARPGHTIHMDYVGPIEEGPSGEKYILTIMDRFSGYTVLVPCEAADSRHAAWGLITYWFVHFGIPKRLITDQGSHFMGWDFDVLRRWLWTEHVRTSAYHPQTNGKIERMHRTLKAGLRKLCSDENSLWVSMLPALCFRINNTKNASGFSPHELMLGWRPHAPFVGETERSPTYSFASQMFSFKEHLARLWRRAAVRNEYSTALSIAQDRRRIRIVEFREGDEVWKIRRPGEGGAYKKATGPCVIERDLTYGRGQSYRVRMPHSNRTKTVNVRDLRPYLRRAGSGGDESQNAYCSWCGDGASTNKHVRCSECPCLFHMRCVGLSTKLDPPRDWRCSQCEQRAAAAAAEAAEEEGDDVDREYEAEVFGKDGGTPEPRSTTTSAASAAKQDDGKETIGEQLPSAEERPAAARATDTRVTDESKREVTEETAVSRRSGRARRERVRFDPAVYKGIGAARR